MFDPASPTEYFRGLVEDAMQNQQVKAAELTKFYLVNLLAGFVHRDQSGASNEAIGVRFVQALRANTRRQLDGLRLVGDLSLFISGFFSDSLNRSLVDVDYYVQLGERSYQWLSRKDEGTFAEVYGELSDMFVPFTDVLSEVSSATRLSSEDQDRLRLYEKWLRTGSRKAYRKLVEQGIMPNPRLRKAFIQ